MNGKTVWFPYSVLTHPFLSLQHDLRTASKHQKEQRCLLITFHSSPGGTVHSGPGSTVCDLDLDGLDQEGSGAVFTYYIPQ